MQYNAFQLPAEEKNSEIYYKRKLCTLGILLGQGEESEKTKLLFENYDLGGRGEIHQSDLRELVADIMEIVLILIPELAVSMFPQNKILKIEAKIMKETNDRIGKLFADFILEDCKKVDLNTFIEKLESREGMKLIRVREMQKYAVRIVRKSQMQVKSLDNLTLSDRTMSSLDETKEKLKRKQSKHFSVI
jgi:hypothetical protein